MCTQKFPFKKVNATILDICTAIFPGYPCRMVGVHLAVAIAVSLFCTGNVLKCIAYCKPLSDENAPSENSLGVQTTNDGTFLRYLATGSAKLTERVEGDEEALVLDSAQDTGASGSGSGDGREKTPTVGGETDPHALHMTTVVYNCSNGIETVEEWRSLESSFSGRHLRFYTFDSAHEQIREGNRTERFIFGEDTRNFVQDSSQFPQCSIARLSTGCTAFFIGPYHALTAAHCVNSFHSGWRRRIDLWRERNCNNRGIWTTCSRVFSVLGHTEYKLYNYDYALIEMEPSNGPSPCWFGIGVNYPWEQPSHINLEAIGYPADKRSYTGQPECSYEAMWSANCNTSYSINKHLVQWCDVLSGNSGSPVFSDVEGNKVVYGIHAQSVGEYVQAEDGSRTIRELWNQGPMITPQRFHQIFRWMSRLQN